MSVQPMLQAANITKKFGSLVAVNNVSLDIYPGEIVGLIGPNGAGKTTFFNALTGLYKPEAGKVTFKGRDITGKPPHIACEMGMSRTFQVIRAFIHMTVEDTIRVGAYNRRSEKNVQEKVDQVLTLCDLNEIRNKVCSDLGLAYLRRIELARALATDPEILLLDETGAGLNPAELASFIDLLNKLNREYKVTFCIVEHVMQMVMSFCQRIVVMDSGELIASGSPGEISNNPRVIEAYLGKRATRC